MIRGLWHYALHDVRRNLRDLLAPELALGFSGGFFFRWAFHHGYIDPAKVDSIAAALLTYATISFGFCVAAISIIINIPQIRFARKLALTHKKSKDGKTGLDAYSNLLFIFSWTAMWHWFMITVTLVFQIFKPHVFHGWQLLLLGGISCYALCLFLITLIAINQFGDAYIRDLRDGPPPPN